MPPTPVSLPNKVAILVSRSYLEFNNRTDQLKRSCVILGFRRVVGKICGLLGNYVQCSGNSLPRCPETSVKNYHYTLRNFVEERRSEEMFIIPPVYDPPLTLELICHENKFSRMAMNDKTEEM